MILHNFYEGTLVLKELNTIVIKEKRKTYIVTNTIGSYSIYGNVQCLDIKDILAAATKRFVFVNGRKVYKAQHIQSIRVVDTNCVAFDWIDWKQKKRKTTVLITTDNWKTVKDYILVGWLAYIRSKAGVVVVITVVDFGKDALWKIANGRKIKLAEAPLFMDIEVNSKGEVVFSTKKNGKMYVHIGNEVIEYDRNVKILCNNDEIKVI
jgi:hypothetical protein